MIGNTNFVMHNLISHLQHEYHMSWLVGPES
jgi:hypothetical protein